MRESTVHQVGVDGCDEERVVDRVQEVLAIEAQGDDRLTHCCPRRDDDHVFSEIGSNMLKTCEDNHTR